ncbi:hypothetical protein JO965_16775 [Microvirga sp. VF16]|nr:hypothetical protein JO965_16775 [Microvirga sp. VF16]
MKTLNTAGRGVTRKMAAEHCCLSLRGFDQWVDKGLLPGPIPGTRRWDLKAIDLRLDELSGIATHKITAEADDDYKRWIRENVK